MHACRNIHETRRVGLYIKGVSHGLKKASFSLDKHPAVLMVIGAIWTLKKTSYKI
jgi:hypothetical protein